MSGPLLDRIDLRVVMPRIDAEQLIDHAAPESSAVVALRIEAAWRVARERNGGIANALLEGRQLTRVCALDPGARRMVKELSAQMDLTARGVHRMMRVARTVADLGGQARVSREDILSASAMRDRTLELESAA